MPRATWECTDPRDEPFDRVFHVYAFDEVAEIKGGHWTVLYWLARPRHGNLDEALVVDRFVTQDVRTLTQALRDVFAGRDLVLRDAAGQPDPDIARNLRNRLDLYRRDGQIDLCFAVYYGAHIPAQERRIRAPEEGSWTGTGAAGVVGQV